MFASNLELFQLAIMTLADSPPDHADGVFLFGETPENERAVLKKGAELFKAGSADALMYTHGGLVNGQHWDPLYEQKLVRLGVPASSIMKACIPKDELANTKTEAEAFIRLAESRGWEKLLVVAPAFHQVRAFATTISIVLAKHLHLKIFSVPGSPMKWTGQSVHSQFTLKGTRFDFLGSELARLKSYSQKGDLASAKEIIDYLMSRDMPEV